MPSSRLTRILQEKAEALKKKRQAAEALQHQAEEAIAQLERLGIALPEVPDRTQRLHESARRSDWEMVETASKGLLAYLAERAASSTDEHRRSTEAQVARLQAAGISIPAADLAELKALAELPADAPWAETVARLVRVEESLAEAGSRAAAKARERAIAVADWAGISPDRRAEFVRSLDDELRISRDGRILEALAGAARVTRETLPEGQRRHDEARERAERRVAVAKEHGVSTATVDEALRADQAVAPDRWPETVPALDRASDDLAETLRAWTSQALTTLRQALDTLSEFGSDPTEAKVAVEEALGRLTTVPVDQAGALLDEARRVAEEPIIAAVAALLDEVRPRITEVRRLGRDPSDVFAAMNRAREALRLKIYSEALAASREAAERVAQLTDDLETARDELQTLEEMLARFAHTGFPREEYSASLGRARAHLDRAEVDAARAELRTTVMRVGREALRHFLDRWTALDRVREYAEQRGFLPEEAARALPRARQKLDAGELADGAELLAHAETTLRTAAAPYVARRVEEMERGLGDIPDDVLTAPVRRLLADADVTLRVKQDLLGAVDSLRRAEREFASVFAVHASALVDLLEEERRVLESMGGAGDEIQRQIDEVQQIFNTGDFVKASRASQEIRTRAQQQQLLRSEEAISHAKLSLVELETLGLDLGRFRGELEGAQAEARAGHYAEAHRLATALEEAAVRTRAETQAVVEEIARAQEILADLRELGVDPEPFYEPIRAARLAFQSLDLGSARATLQVLRRRLVEAMAGAESDRLFGEIDRLIEDGRRLAAPMEAYTARLEALRTERATAPPEATRTATRALHEELVALLVPILEENLRGLERDLDIARAAGVDLEKIVAPLAEARRRTSLPVPIGAAALLDAARAEFVSTRGLVEHAERVARRTREALSQADLLRVEAGPLHRAMEEVSAALAQREYARAIELGGALEREVTQATYQHVSKTLAGFRATVTRLRGEASDTTVAENLLHQARMALDEGRPVDAVQLASRSESELERVELQRRIAEGSVAAADGAFQRARREGIVVASVGGEVDQARALFQRRDYPAVFEQCLSVFDDLEGLRDGHRRAREAIGAADRQVAEAAALGAEVGEARGRLAEAHGAAAGGQYPEAVRAAREATELGRWAIEKLFAGPVGGLRHFLESGHREGLGTELEPVERPLAEAEAALRARDWERAREAIARAEPAADRVFAAVVDVRWREVEALLDHAAPVPEGEAAETVEFRARLADVQLRRDLGLALRLLREAREKAARRRRASVEALLAQLKDQLWVGERLGVDTTPIMQLFGEARVAIDSDRTDEAEALYRRGLEALERAVQEPFDRRRAELLAEINFAADGLRVSVGPIRDRFAETEKLAQQHRGLEGARQILRVEEDLNLRKSLHRELMNLHYLIDAALARAGERRIDTSEARSLLAESIRLREQDYPAALAKARDALRRLQSDLPMPAAPAAGVSAEPKSAADGAPPPFWPFRRPPS